ncbi:ParA family protein [Streptomyces lavendulocolor]|uniref:ParA family protein n=1 Tax=Streptomyces lavendulocolor TaxID=67316 RepID=UPI003C2BABFC
MAIGNNKGGSGKTALIVNLAAALADQGRRVLVVDVDPQANASRRLGRPFLAEAPTVTVSEVVKDGRPGVAVDGIVPCAWEGVYGMRIDVLPSRWDLEERVSEAAVMGARQRLRSALDGADDAYDVTLIDTPPNLGHLTQLGLAAARWTVAVSEPERDGVAGAVRIRDFVQSELTQAELGNPELEFLAAVPSRVDSRVGSHDHHVGEMRRIFGDMLWEAVHERAPIKDAADEALPLAALGARSREVRETYAILAERLWKAVSA